MDTALDSKYSKLRDRIAGLGDVVVAYSGGVDSTLLAEVAHEVLGGRALAVTAVSPSLARRERDAASAIATERGWNHLEVGTHEMRREEYLRNDGDRCYWCKTELFEVLGPIAAERNAAIAVGTNVDDLSDYRPGSRAAQENGVATPFLDAELTKAEIRLVSERLGLPTSDKPASPCLSSRFAYGVRVTPQGLRRIDAAEDFVRSLGFDVLRVRDHGGLARLEVPKDQIARAAELAGVISTKLHELGFEHVSLDMEGFRSGSLNAALPLPTLRK